MSMPEYHMFAAAPASVAPFSHACEADGWVFITGQLPIDPGNEAAPLPEGIEAQTHKTFDNLLVVLEGLGLGLENVVSARAFLTDFYGDYALQCGVRQLLPRRQTPGAHLHRHHGPGAACAGGDRLHRQAAMTGS